MTALRRQQPLAERIDTTAIDLKNAEEAKTLQQHHVRSGFLQLIRTYRRNVVCRRKCVYIILRKLLLVVACLAMTLAYLRYRKRSDAFIGSFSFKETRLNGKATRRRGRSRPNKDHSKSDLHTPLAKLHVGRTLKNGEVNPTLSTPPLSIPLYEPSQPTWVQGRHACLDAIRSEQMRLIAPLVQKATHQNDPIERLPPILLVDPAYHSNVGDHMITLGEHTFLRRLFYKSWQECNYVQSGRWAPPCVEPSATPSTSHSVALWHGGGNWGDLWVKVQQARTESMTMLLQPPNATVIGMPESLFFQNKTYMYENAKELQRHVKLAHGAKRLFLTWREQESYAQAQTLYPFAQHLLVSDIAFQLGPYKPLLPSNLQEQVDVLLLLRQDHESTYARSEKDRSAIRRALDNLSSDRGRYSFSVVDWPDRLARFDSTDHYFTDTSIQLLSLGRVVICDRLHAAILAYLVGLPFVYLDQISGKIDKTLRVAFRDVACQDRESLRFARAHNLTHGLQTAVEFLEKYHLLELDGRAVERQRRRKQIALQSN